MREDPRCPPYMQLAAKARMSCPIPKSMVGTRESIVGSLTCFLEKAQTKKDPGFEVSLCASEGPRGALPSA